MTREEILNRLSQFKRIAKNDINIDDISDEDLERFLFILEDIFERFFDDIH